MVAGPSLNGLAFTLGSLTLALAENHPAVDLSAFRCLTFVACRPQDLNASATLVHLAASLRHLELRCGEGSARPSPP